jgi:hypothetical protein
MSSVAGGPIVQESGVAPEWIDTLGSQGHFANSCDRRLIHGKVAGVLVLVQQNQHLGAII